MIFRTKHYFTFILILILSGCGVYSFTGASISPDVKTISIQYIYNDSGNGPPSLQQTFTEKIRDYYSQNTSLEFTKNSGDLQIEGMITGYVVRPVAVTSSGNPNQLDNAAAQRLTITVKISYANLKDESFDFQNKQFLFYADFDPTTTTLTAVEDELIETIADQIIVDIFNATVANW